MAPDPPAVVIENLTKRLGGGVMAVAGLNLTVERGRIVGLAGPNGAGKSITLKILLGLVRPTSGRAELFGQPVGQGARVLERVGAMVDGPGFVPHLSGLENLRLACRMLRRPDPDTDIERAIAIAGLGEALGRKYHTYSHGMRYRLGLAQALLGQPELLLLDEPTTGLDPAHQHEIRRAIVNAAHQGATVLLSSHLLDEVEGVCTHAAIMRLGRLVVEGSVNDLIREADTMRIEVDAPYRAAAALRSVAGVIAATAEDTSVKIDGRGVRPVDLFLALDAASVIARRYRRGRSLEDAYLELVGPGQAFPETHDH